VQWGELTVNIGYSHYSKINCERLYKSTNGHMKKSLPAIFLVVGLLFSFILLGFSPSKTGGLPSLPLLATLYMSEFGMMITLVGAWLSGRDAYQQIARGKNALICVGNLLLAVNLFFIGLKVWPNAF